MKRPYLAPRRPSFASRAFMRACEFAAFMWFLGNLWIFLSVWGD